MTSKVLRAAAALVIALGVFLMAGCGGEEEQPSTQIATATSTTRTAAKAPAGSTNKAENLTGQTVVPTDLTPQDVKKSLQSRRAVVVNFYMTSPYDDSQVRSYITSLQSKYQGQVDFYTFLYTDGQRFGDLMDVLMVNATPTVVVINRQGKVQRAWTGYVDAKSIEQGIVESLK